MPTYSHKDRVRDTTTSTGTGDLTLSGTAPTGFQSFSDAFGVGPSFFYGIQVAGGAEWEVGLGHLSSSTTLVRDTVYDSNTGSAVNFSAGTKDVFCTLPASEGKAATDAARALAGGTTGQALTKASNADYDFAWGAGGGGQSFYSIAQGDRVAYDTWTGSGTYDTVSNATLTGASAVAALCIVLYEFGLTATGSAGDSFNAYTTARATGSAETEATDNLIGYTGLQRVVAGVGSFESLHHAVIACGTGGNAGKFDVAVDDAPSDGVTITTTIIPIGYWA